jgi:hypothetical protein
MQIQTQTIVNMLNNRADAKLRKRLNDALTPIFEECRGHQPDNQPWIGDLTSKLHEVATAYLTPSYRTKENAEFLAKLESVSDEINDLRDQIPNP